MRDDSCPKGKIPIFDDDIFETIYEVFDWNFKEAYERYGDADQYINVAMYSTDTCFDDIEVTDHDEIIDNVTFEYLVENFDQLENVPTVAKIIEKSVFEINGIDKVILYNQECDIARMDWLHINFRTYVKSIYFSKTKFIIPFLIDGINLNSMWLNINNPNIIPNVARNDINKEQKEEIAFAIGKAIHLWILDNIYLSSEQVKLLRKFIEEKYSGENIFLKKKND